MKTCKECAHMVEVRKDILHCGKKDVRMDLKSKRQKKVSTKLLPMRCFNQS